jgi:dehydrogenase/reductase SDR family protein 1
MKSLQGKVALVTGASRGVGKGIALGLGEAGATVYITGRTIEEGHAAVNLPGTIYQTAEEVTRIGGKGIAIQCDHLHDEEVETVFQRIRTEQERLDILVNNVWGGYEQFWDGTEFWKETGFWTTPLSRWDKMFVAGVRAHYVASVYAAPIMIAQKSGLIVHISSPGAKTEDSGTFYGSSKAATDRMAINMAYELRKYNIAVVSLYPGLVRTESVLKASQYFDLSNSESPQFIGRAIVALATDPEVMKKTGKVLVAAALAQGYDFTDVDGTQPKPIT